MKSLLLALAAAVSLNVYAYAPANAPTEAQVQEFCALEEVGPYCAAVAADPVGEQKLADALTGAAAAYGLCAQTCRGAGSPVYINACLHKCRLLSLGY